MILNVIKLKRNFIFRLYHKNKLIQEKCLDNLNELQDVELYSKVKCINVDYSFVVCYKQKYPILSKRRLIKEQKENIEKVYDGKYVSINNQFIKDKNNIIVISYLIESTVKNDLYKQFQCPIIVNSEKLKCKNLYLYIDEHNLVFKKDSKIIFCCNNWTYEKIIMYLYFINYEGDLTVLVNKNSSINLEEVQKYLSSNIESKVSLNIEYV